MSDRFTIPTVLRRLLTAAKLSLAEIRQMFDEMWAANGEALSLYE